MGLGLGLGSETWDWGGIFLLARTFRTFTPVSRRLIPVIAVLGPVAVTLLVYRDALSADFVFDDHHFLSELWCWQIDDWSRLPEVPFTPGCRYRTLRYVSLAIDHLLWGRNPAGYHLTNLLLHAVAVGLVYGVLQRLVQHRGAAMLGALVWALHPVHTDVVTYVAGRRDLLFTVFYLAAFLTWPREYRGLRTLVRAGPALLLFGLALLSKEMAVTLPAVLVLERLLAPTLEAARAGVPTRARPAPLRGLGRLLRRQVLPLGAVVAVAAVAVVYRGFLHPLTGGGERLFGGSLGSHVLTVLAAYGRYLELIVWPTRLYSDYSDFPVATTLADPRVLAGIATVAAVWIGGLVALRRAPFAAFGLLWFGGTMLPVSHIIPHHELLAEHYLYLPLIGLAVPLTRGLSLLFARGETTRVRRLTASAARVTLGALLFLCAQRVESRNLEFSTRLAFAKSVLREVPEALRGHLELAQAQREAGYLKGALDSFLWVSRRAPPGTRHFTEVQHNIIAASLGTGDLGRAEAHALRLTEVTPRDAYGPRMLGVLRAQEGRLEEAVALQEQALVLDPENVEGRLHLGVTLLRMNRPEEAAPHVAFAIERWPTSAYAWLQWAGVAEQRGESAVAAERYERALALEPGNGVALRQLDALLRATGELARLRRAYEASLEVAPDDLVALDGLGRLLAETGERDLACAVHWRMRALSPELAARPPFCPPPSGAAGGTR